MGEVIELGGPADLTADAYEAIVYRRAGIALKAQALRHVAWSRDMFLRHLDTGAICYGVTTGLGAQSKLDLTPGQRLDLPRRTLLGRASGTGPPLPAEAARGALLAKLVQFLDGHSAVSADLCGVLADRLNRGLTPCIPSRGLGMAGEIIPLCHAGQTLIGEGFVLAADGRCEPAAAWHAAQRLAPYEPQAKEGLSLINGAAVSPALAWHLGRRLDGLLELANQAAAASIEGLAAPLEAYDRALLELRRDPGMGETIAALNALLAGTGIARQQRQAPVSYRITPQVHGMLHEAIRRLRAEALAELRANGDNPAFLPDDASPVFGRLLHTGNFHGAALAAATEGLSLAVVQAGLLAERRCYRLLDARASGLKPQLAHEPGLDAGLITVHKAAIDYAARLKLLAAPASVMQADSSFGQEDAMSLIFPALDRLREAIDMTIALLGHEMLVASVAIDQRGRAPAPGVAQAIAEVLAGIPPYRGDRSYGPTLDALIGLLMRRCDRNG